ncbi:MAG: HU family DNA-binding protein [Phycisphaeraceae bacterium]|nr:HU family DNA-binding protein [Phycisphaerales bacterium]MCB9861191.1 HU family DNA-binding protein [Phycisphaeraceae bacterium]
MARKTTTRKTTRKAATKKTPARRPAAKGTSKRKPTAAAAPRAAKPAKITAARDKARTKSEILNVLAEHAGVTRKDVATIFDTMNEMIVADLRKGGCGKFTVPGMMKVMVQRKPATKARKGINPFTGEETVFKAKPARNVVKIRPLKGLKDAV